MPLGPNDSGNTDPFLGSASLNFKYPVTGGAPGSVTPSADRNGVSSDISDELKLSDNTQGDFEPADELKDGQHADALAHVPGAMGQKPMPRQGFTVAEVEDGLQLSQQQQSSFPYTQVEGLVEPVAAQGSLDPAESMVHSDVTNEVPALKDIDVVVRDNDPSNDYVHSDPFMGSEDSPFSYPEAPTGLVVSVSVVAGKYRMTFNWDNAPAGSDVVAWVLLEKDSEDRWAPVPVPHTYPWTNNAPNSLLDSIFITASNEDVLLDRVSNGTFEFAVQAINSLGYRSENSNEVSVNLFPAPAGLNLLVGGTASWTAVPGIGAVGYQYQLDNNATPGAVWQSTANTTVAGLNLAPYSGGNAYIHVRVNGSPNFSTDFVAVP
jgi:hypothetical protein